MRFLSLFFFLPIFLLADEYTISLGALGSIRYTHEEGRMMQIDRLSRSDETLYTHYYGYDEMGRLISETLIGGLGKIIYESPTVSRSPYHLEICEYDTHHNLVRRTQDETTRDYFYNNLNELILEDSPAPYEYDLSGNLIQKGETFFSYDENHKLIKVTSKDAEVTFTYDSEGRRASKTSNGKTERYIFEGINEIAIIGEDGLFKALRIPGISTNKEIIRPIAIETRDAIYAPIHDVQGNIIKLIDIFSRKVISLSLPDPFGRGLSNDSPIPWIFAGKNYDPDTGLIYFGHMKSSSMMTEHLVCSGIVVMAIFIDQIQGRPVGVISI